MWQKYMPSMIFMANRWDECRRHRQHSCHPFYDVNAEAHLILGEAKDNDYILFLSIIDGQRVVSVIHTIAVKRLACITLTHLPRIVQVVRAMAT